MTREEAIRAVKTASDLSENPNIWDAYVRMFEALGVLQLDDPAEEGRLAAISYLEEKFVEVQSTGNARNSERLTRAGAAEILDILLKNGFKITR